MGESSPDTLHVAVGVVFSHNQQVLICWRDASLHQGNRHEFPGGKIEVNETPQQALRRELSEELNIEVTSALYAQRLIYHYPEKTVCLHVFKVNKFEGTPVGQQQQAVHWIHRYELNRYSFPDANLPILKMAQLPDYYVIAQDLSAPLALENRVQSGWQDWLQWHVLHTPVGAWLYVRYKTADSVIYQKIIETLHQARPDLYLLVMSEHIDALKSCWLFLKGINFSQHALLAAKPDDLQQLPAHLFRIAACHDLVSVQQANQLAMDAIVLSPVLSTATHADIQPLGWQQWQQLALQSHVPVYALGGLQPDDLDVAQQHGAFGIAGIRAFFKP